MTSSSTPLRLPLWDRASAEFYFARSRDLLTKCSPYMKGHLSRSRLQNQNERNGHLIRTGSVGSEVRCKTLSKNVSDGRISDHCERLSFGSSPPTGTGSLTELIQKYGSPPKENGNSKVGKSLTELLQKYGSPPKDALLNKCGKNAVRFSVGTGSPVKRFAALYKGPLSMSPPHDTCHPNGYNTQLDRKVVEKSVQHSKQRLSVPKIHLSLAVSEDSSDSFSSSQEDISRRSRRPKFRRVHPNARAAPTCSSDSSPDECLKGVVADVVAGLWAGRSPPPPTSFLNSLSPPYPGHQGNSDTSSDSENLDLSEYPEFARDFLTFPPSPAPSPTA